VSYHRGTGDLPVQMFAVNTAAPPPATSDDTTTYVILGGLGVFGYLLYRHFKKKG